jgi:hypothetical protein
VPTVIDDYESPSSCLVRRLRSRLREANGYREEKSAGQGAKREASAAEGALQHADAVFEACDVQLPIPAP